jgi:hypothetical protein
VGRCGEEKPEETGCRTGFSLSGEESAAERQTG